MLTRLIWVYLLASGGLTDPGGDSEAAGRLSEVEPRHEQVLDEEITPALRDGCARPGTSSKV